MHLKLAMNPGNKKNRTMANLISVIYFERYHNILLIVKANFYILCFLQGHSENKVRMKT